MESFTPPPAPPRSPSSVGPLFFLWWILANSIGIVLGVMLLMVLDATLDIRFFLFLPSSPVGVMQWLVLKKYLHEMGWWVVATVVGFVIGVVLFGFLNFLLYDDYSPLFLGIRIPTNFYFKVLFLRFIWGFSLGISQWLVLRKKVYRSQWWILATTITGGFDPYSWHDHWFKFGVFNLAYLLMTTPTMFFLLKRPKRQLISDQYEN